MIRGAASDKDFIQCKEWPSPEERQRGHAPLWMLVALWMIVAAAALAYCHKANSAPKAESREECEVAADMVLTARALSEEGIGREKTEAVMRRIYAIEPVRGEPMLASLINTAMRPDAPEAGELSAMLLRACLRFQGDMDSILGSDV